MIKKRSNKKKCNCFDQGGFLGGYPASFGFPVTGALDYSLRADSIMEKQQKDSDKVSMNSNVNAGVSPALFAYGGLLSDAPTMFAIGGDMQTNSADFSTGLTHIDAGGSHEESPYDGVQLGLDPEGIPNLVEEGEVVFNDYVYSRRITLDEKAKKKFHFPKKAETTYADAAKRLEKEIKERPNDPISKASFKAQMEQLADEQERQKQEMEAERAKEAFEALSPEEQTAIMQRVAQEEAMAQQAVQQQAVAEAQGQPTPEEVAMAQQQVSPEEAAMMQQQMVAQQGMPVEADMAAYGGRINKFDKGGVLRLLKSLGYKTVKDAEKAGWSPSDFGDYTSWNDITDNSKLSDNFVWTDEFSKRLTSPEQKAALSLGWNPLAELVERKWYEGDNGNDVGWTQSYGKDKLNAEEFKDYAKRYKNTLGWAVENGIIEAPKDGETISMTDVVKAMGQSPDWKATDNWLYSDPAHMAEYLGLARGLNPDDDTKFINKWSPFGTFTKGDNGWTYTLRDNLSDAEKKTFADLFRKGRTDNHVGVMYNSFQDPGTSSRNYLIDEDGNPVLITSDDLSGYEKLGTPITWGDVDNNINNTVTFYRDPAAVAPVTAPEEATKAPEAPAEEAREIAPVHLKEWPRYAGLFGPAVGLGLMTAGVGKPDTSGLDAAIKIANGPANLADAEYIGDYERYIPLDRMFHTNQLMANARATDRALTNSVSPSKAAGLLANGYNTVLGLGNLARQAEEYNDALYHRTKEFNRGTNQFNAEAYNRLSQFNADALNRQKQLSAQLGLQAVREKMDADAGWYNSLYGNISGLFKGISDLGRENRETNWRNAYITAGGAGPMDEQALVDAGIARWKDGKSSAKGGKLKKRRGLTI